VRGDLRQLVVILGVGLLAACGGGGGEDGAAELSPTTAAPTTTTAVEHRIDVYQPIPGGSLHGTPRPPLENTGDDYVAITESLIANFRWLTENPKIDLLGDVFVPGTPGHDARVDAYSRLLAEGLHWADEGYHLRSVTVVSSVPETATLVVDDVLEYERVVDDDGNPIGETRWRNPPEKSTALVLARAADGRWRIADWQQLGDPVVEL
jgi:hypothetical protein